MSQCCNWQIDLRVVKTVTSAPPTGVGSTVVFNVVWSNKGPDRARNVTIADRMTAPASIGVTAATVVGLVYSGGATGPTTTTYGALATGVVIPLMPVGSTVTAVIAGSVQALPADPTRIAFAGSVLSNTATGAAPGHTIINGDTGVEYLVVESTQVVVLPPECYLRCDDELVLYKDSGIVSGAGVCIGIKGVGFVAGRAVWQARDDTFLLGSGSTNSGGSTSAYLQETYTNPWPEPALLRVDVQTQANAVAVNGPTPGGTPLLGKHVTIIHNIGETLGVSPPNFGGTGGPIPTNWAWSTIETSNPSVHWDDSTQVYGYKPLTQVSNSMFYERFLQPGGSVTLYSQFWATFYSEGVYWYAVHGGMRPTAKLFRNAGAMA